MHLNIRSTFLYFFFLSCGVVTAPAAGMTISGTIVASTVTVSGNVTVSSMTVSTMTISNSLMVTGAALNIPGRVVQIEFSSTTAGSEASTTTWQSSADLQNTIALLNPNDYLEIFLGGGIGSSSVNHNAYVTIFRDTTNLGDSNYGLSGFVGGGSTNSICPVGFTFIDK